MQGSADMRKAVVRAHDGFSILTISCFGYLIN